MTADLPRFPGQKGCSPGLPMVGSQVAGCHWSMSSGQGAERPSSCQKPASVPVASRAALAQRLLGGQRRRSPCHTWLPLSESLPTVDLHS